MEINAKYLSSEWERKQSENREITANMAYVSGKNPPIINSENKPKPDNRIPVPMAKMAVMTVVGYAGRPGDIKTEYNLIDAPENSETTDYQDVIREYSKLNDEDIENSELLGTALSQGRAYELWWVSEEDGEIVPEYKIVPSTEACPVFTDSLKPELEAFIRFWEDRDRNQIADVYYPYYSERWVRRRDESEFLFDASLNEQYPYSVVPAIEFNINMHGTPIYQAEKPLIDSYDSAISKSQNEVDRFNAAILELPGKLSAEAKRDLREGDEAIFDELDRFDNWPEYLQKNLEGINEFYKSHSSNLERLFHKSIGIPDISDESFAGNQSGVAIAYKLIPLEFLTSQLEAYFRQGLVARKQLYDDFIGFFSPEIDTEGYKVTVDWKRNIPVDETAKVQAAGILSSILSPEAILRWLPNTIVPDVEEELQREELIQPVSMDEFNADPAKTS